MATQIRNVVGSMIVVLLGMAAPAFAQTLERYSFAEPHLGTIVELTFYADEETAANEAARLAFDRIKQLDRIFSDYKPDSEAMQLCSHAQPGSPTSVSQELFQVLKMSQEISRQSDGAFDVTVGPMVQLWRQSRKNRKLPSPDEIQHAKGQTGWQHVRLDDERQSVMFDQTGIRLDFGGIAKGYIAQEASQKLKERGFSRSLVAVSGDIVVGDPPPGSPGWKVAVASVKATVGSVETKSAGRMLQLQNCATSTSGDTFQFVEIDGVRYSHVVNPQTGIGMTRRTSVTVIAPTGLLADGLDTAICVMGPKEGLRLIQKFPSVEAYVVQLTDAGLETFESPGFARQEIKPAPE